MLNRQNNLISDIFGNYQDFIILIGLFVDDDIVNKNYEELDLTNQYQKVDRIDLHKIRPDEYDEEMYYEVLIKSERWEKNSLNDILRKIADDEIRAMFINPNAECIIVPYDGGVDIILKNTETRDSFKTKYADWLSKREDGL